MLSKIFYSTITAIRFALIVLVFGFVAVYAGAPALFGILIVSASAVAAVWMWGMIAFAFWWVLSFVTFGFIKKAHD